MTKIDEVEKKVPELRFAGFSDEWVPCKLGDFLTRAHRPTVGRNLVTVSENQTTLRTQEDQGYNSKLTAIDTTKYAGINFGDVLVDLSSYSRGFYISTMDGLTSKAYHVLSHDFKEYRLIFLKYILVNRQILKQLPGITPVGVRQGKSLPVGDVLTLNVSLPSEAKEQQKIGSVFSTLDHKIGLEERQIALLKDLKKGFLQKMFPKNGAKVPELRFAGFADDWEERKLGDITTSFSGGTPSAGNPGYYKGDIPFIRSGEINSDKTELFLTEDGLKNSSAKMVSVGDILYALYGATSGEVGLSQINGAINQAILAIRPIGGYSSHFIMQWLRLQKQKIIDKYLQGGQGNLSGSIVKNLILNVPILEEQQKIGAFFKQLDNTIEHHQRKLDLLKDLKKGLSQQMFV